MISLQSHNQVLYHLAQVTSAINTRSSPFTIRVKPRHETSSSKSVDELCQESFLEAVKNCTELPRVQFDTHNLYSKLHSRKNNVWIILDNVSLKYTKEHPQSSPRWKQSYVSSWSFTENKRDFPCSQVTKPVILPAIYLSSTEYKPSPHWCSKIPFTHHGQVRGFKTKRNINAELERNSTLSNRFKQWLGHTNMLDPESKPKLTAVVKESDVERLKQMFKNADVSADEQKRIKTAFAEGYEAALHRSNRNRPLWWKTVLNVFLLCAFVVCITLIVSGSSGIFKFAIGDRVEINPEEIHVTFNDVKGVDQAKQELKDVVEFLKNPDKFSALGGKLPKGVLLVGPPGTGKTLLARAVAGEASVPFFQAAGPEFDEILVGQGARRVRELFKSAKEKAPCVVFIDEIDSVGSKRTNSVLHPYANQTINQLLSEMDGFHQNEGVIVLGATNRRHDLDKALLRPGRFDVEIYVDTPDYIGRKEILELYLSRVLTKEINLEFLARCTTGFTGADIENMINQAALKAAIDGAEYVTMEHIEKARDKVIMGPEGKLRSNDQDLIRITAYHEGGHALVAHYTKDAMPLHKVTIIPRGSSLGHTSYLPAKDAYLTTKTELLAQMDTMMGGRAAEELIFGTDRVTTGASKDFEEATRIAESMVKHFGMSEKVGLRWHTDPDSRYQTHEYSPNTKELIDSEVKRLLQESYERAKNILRTHAKEHVLLAEALLKYETLDAEDVKAIATGKKLRTEVLTNKTTPIIDVAPKNVM